MRPMRRPAYHPRMPAEVGPNISLRKTTVADLPTLFRQQLDAESNVMAGTKPYTEGVYHARLRQILADANVIPMVIVEGAAETIVGTISCFQRDGQDMVGYWIDRSHWGRGIASRALAMFIREVIPPSRRPLHAHVVTDNAPSIRVLTKCGFRPASTFAGEETDRYVAREVTAFVLD
jgi:RimJ/RimL family protein N-acetyltransferase